MMQSQFQNLDRIRLDKYLLFIRIFTAEICEWLNELEWSDESIEQLVFILTSAGPFRGMFRQSLHANYNLMDSLPRKFIPSAGCYLGLTCHFLKVFKEELIFRLSDPEVPPGVELSEEDKAALEFETNRLTQLRSPVLDNILPFIMQLAAECEYEAVAIEASNFIHGLLEAFKTACALNELCTMAFSVGADPKTDGQNRSKLYELVSFIESLGGHVDSDIVKQVQAALSLNPNPDLGAKKSRMSVELETGVKMNRRERARQAREARMNGEVVDSDDEAPLLVDAADDVDQNDTASAMKALLKKFGAGPADEAIHSDEEDEDDEEDDEEADWDDLDDLDEDDDEEEEDSEVDDDSDADTESEAHVTEEDNSAEIPIPVASSKRVLRASRNSIEVNKNRLQQAQQLEADEKKKKFDQIAASAAAQLEKKSNEEKLTDQGMAKKRKSSLLNPSEKNNNDIPTSTVDAVNNTNKGQQKKKNIEMEVDSTSASSSSSSLSSVTVDTNLITPTGKRFTEKKLTMKGHFSVMKFSHKKPASSCRRSSAVVAPPLVDVTGKVKPAYRAPTPLSTSEGKIGMDDFTKSQVDIVRASVEQKRREIELMNKKQMQIMRLAEINKQLNAKAKNHSGNCSSNNTKNKNHQELMKDKRKQKILAKFADDDE